MAKRELSSTLRNLKFMQRAIQRDEKTNKDEEKTIPSTTPNRQCIVIMEGNPRPGALKGRMSFQSFNPTVDKLNEDAEKLHETQNSTAGGTDQSNIPDRGVGVPESETDTYAAVDNSESTEHKSKKKAKIESQMENAQGTDQGKPSNNKAVTTKQQKQDRLDWRLLRPPTGQNRPRN